MRRTRFMPLALLAVAAIVAAGAIGIGLAAGEGGRAAPAARNGGPMPATAEETALGDQDFIRMMIPHHQMAIEMATLALTRAEHPETRRLARRIIRSQGSEIAQMRAWYEAWYGDEPEPAAMDAMHMGTSMPLDELAAAAPFDRAFLAQMIPHHAAAIVMASQLDGAHPELAQLATAIIGAQAREIGTMQRWRAAWYPPLG